MGRIKEMQEYEREIRLEAQAEMFEAMRDSKEDELQRLLRLQECLNEIRMGVSQIEHVTANKKHVKQMIPMFKDLNDWIDEAEKAIK